LFSKIPRKEISVFEKPTGVIGVSEKSRVILDWYKNRKQNRRLARTVEEEDYTTKEPLAEQLA
jgi:hypothetical protein